MSPFPGEQPHADRPNWRPADNIDDYLRNVREGLEAYSDRRAGALLGWSRQKLWRVRKAGRLPEDLFERLLAQSPVPSFRELAAISDTLFDGAPAFDAAECCPHCGGPLRVRRRFRKSSAAIVCDWLEERQP